jgi:hypothetical protein
MVGSRTHTVVDELPGQVSININIAADTPAHEVEEKMHSIQRVLRPERYCPPPYVEVENDEFGTPLKIMALPNIYDTMENMKMHGRNVVSPMSMLMMRVQWGPFKADADYGSPDVPFEHMAVHLGNGKAFVFIVSNGEAVTLTDEPGIFPSDALITQVRMLAERSRKT